MAFNYVHTFNTRDSFTMRLGEEIQHLPSALVNSIKSFMGAERLLIHLRTLDICLVYLVLKFSDASIRVVQVIHHFPPLVPQNPFSSFTCFEQDFEDRCGREHASNLVPTNTTNGDGNLISVLIHMMDDIMLFL